MSSDTLLARSFHGRVIQGLGAPGAVLLIRKVEKWNESQEEGFIVLQYFTQSPEI